jgi:hypothetical protein
MLLGLSLFGGCKHEEIDISPDAKLTFSADTVKMGNLFSGEYSPRAELHVYNRNSSGARIDSITLRDGAVKDDFELIVDGYDWSAARNVVIAGNDSVIVYLSMNPVENGSDDEVKKDVVLDFHSGKTVSTVIINANVQDVNRLSDYTVAQNMRFDSAKPYRINGDLTVGEGATLALAAGSKLYFNGGQLTVAGNIVSDGTADKPVLLTGGRVDNITENISYDYIPSQWNGLRFGIGSQGNKLTHTVVKNCKTCVTINGLNEKRPDLTLVNCRVSNAGDEVISADDAKLTFIGCELTDAGSKVVSLYNCETVMNHCTVANNFILGIPGGALVAVTGGKINISNSIIYGMGGDVSFNGNADYMVKSCLLKLHGDDESRYQSVIWGEDPKFKTIREKYQFDYRVEDGSPAKGAGDATLTREETRTDFYGLERGNTPDLGAYVVR